MIRGPTGRPSFAGVTPGRASGRWCSAHAPVSGPEEPRIVRNEIPLYPVYPEELLEMLANAGFGDIRFFGDFARSEFSAGSEAVVCLARKA